MELVQTPSVFLPFVLLSLTSALIIGIIIYVVFRIRAKAKIKKEMQQAESLNVIGHLAASVAHEIRNPLTVVRGFMQIFSKEAFVPDEKKAYIELMIRELDRAEKIINNYLTLAKPRVEVSEKINLVKQIDDVKDIISSYGIINNVSIVQTLEDDLFIQGSKEKLNQVFVNLLKNAIEASPHGERVEISAFRRQKNIVVNITDYGVGLTSEEIKLLGVPYYSTKKKGTGLGLMVSYGIIQSMQGKIEVQSEKGKGSTFSLIFKSQEE